MLHHFTSYRVLLIIHSENFRCSCTNLHSQKIHTQNTHAQICAHAHTCAHTHTHMHTYIHTHACTQTDFLDKGTTLKNQAHTGLSPGLTN